MTPIVKEEFKVSVDASRVREIAKTRHVTITFIAENIHVTYRQLCRLLSAGEMPIQYLNKICDVLDINSSYLIGKSDRIGHRNEDFYSLDILKDSLKQIMKFSEMPHYMDKIDSLTGVEIEDIVSVIVALIDSPDDFYSLVPIEKLDDIHHNKVFNTKEN